MKKWNEIGNYSGGGVELSHSLKGDQSKTSGGFLIAHFKRYI